MMKSLRFKRMLHSKLWKFEIIACSIIHFFYSCTNDALEIALQKAGKNRSEMEKVLDYFQQSPRDSLKYRAARFLIENMPGHVTYSNDSINHLRMHEDKLPNSKSRWAAYLHADLIQSRYASLSENNKLQISEDIENLTSQFLIEHIESVFHKLDSCAWSQDIDFEVFCEYLLPYRLGQEKPFLWRDSILDGFPQLQNYIKNYADTRTSALALSRRLPHTIHIPWRETVSLLPSSMHNHFPDCEDTAIRNLLLYRLCNIPAAIDMIPCWGNYNGQHAWAQPIEKRRRYTDQLEKFGWTTIPKVYRRTFSLQSIPKNNEYIPPFFQDQHLKDVTDEYLYTVEVEESNFPENIHYGYLCVFNRGKWLPVAQTVNDSGKCIFSKMGTGVVYLPAYYKNSSQLVAISNPFRLTDKGEKIYFNANKKKEDLLLDRKYPLNSAVFINPTTNIIIEASNSFNLHQCDTFKINKDLLMQPLDIKVKPHHRYFRISPIRDAMIAEIYFFDNNNNKRIYAHIEKTNQYKEHLQDNDILTYEYIHPTTFSLTPADTVTFLRILPYNDGNGIYPGDDYELFYFDRQKQWISCGYKTADNYSITFKDVPQGALYWLQNLTTGKEERIFTYENGQQKFW